MRPASDGAGPLSLQVEVVRGSFRLRVALASEVGVLALVGPSGAGKSTLLQAIAGLVTPREGEIRVGERVLFRRGAEGPAVNLPARERRAGYVFQDYALFPHLSALENVAYALGRGEGARRRAREEMERLGIEELADRRPDQLSGGQQQRVAIARALASEPRFLLLDEPFGALDPETRRKVRGEVRRILREARLPVVFVTHDREEALALADRVAVLDRGELLEEGEPLAVLGHPTRERVARLVGVENLFRLEVVESRPTEGITLCRHGELPFELPLLAAAPGEEVRVGVRAGDVLLAVGEPGRLSARNVLPGEVVAVRSHGGHLEVEVDCGGLFLRAHITRAARNELGIVPGVRVRAVLKSASCVVLAG